MKNMKIRKDTSHHAKILISLLSFKSYYLFYVDFFDDVDSFEFTVLTESIFIVNFPLLC
jgi:hypothetical protein